MVGFSVKKTGKLFEAGDYPDKSFTLSPEEARLAVQEFQPAPLGVEHTPTIFDGMLGMVDKVWIADDNVSIYGESTVPTWLADLFPDEPLKVSCEWDRATKRITKVGLVQEPRVADAALMAAFAKHDTGSGQSNLQMIHNLSASCGAVCDKKNTSATMASAHESKAMQQIHDIATEHGAMCDSIRDSQNQASLPYAAYTKEKTPMKWGEYLTKILGGKADEEVPTDASLAIFDEPSKPTAPAPALTTVTDPRLDAITKQLEIERQARIRSEAAQFAQNAIHHEKKAVPAEQNALIQGYVQAAVDDLDRPTTVKFGKDGAQEGSRLDAFKDSIAVRSPHLLTEELMKSLKIDDDNSLAIFMNKMKSEPTKDADPDEKRRKELMEMTPVGRAVMFSENSNGKGA